MDKYNLYFNFFNKWQWRNVSRDKLKDIIFNKYSTLIKHFNEKIYNDLRIELLTDANFTSLKYKDNNKSFITITKTAKK